MQLSRHHYSPNTGWNAPLNGALDSRDTLIIVFGPADLGPVIPALEELQKTFHQSIWTGCSTAGEVFGSTITDDTLSVAVIRFDHTQLKVSVHPIETSEESLKTGKEIAHSLSAPDLKAIFLLSDGLMVNGSELVKGLSAQLSPSVIIAGGLAADGTRFSHTWVIADQVAKEKHISAIGFYGEHVHISHSSHGGWDALGPEREVTESKGNVLYSLDNEPALELYKKYLGDRAAGLPATGLLFPLSIGNDREADAPTIRTILSVDEATNSITFAGDLPQGAKVRLMRANFERLVGGASTSARALCFDGYQGGPLLGLTISCVGRRLVLGQRTEEELEALLDGLPQQFELVGFYSYGEISPLASGHCELHNQTITLTVIWED